MLLKALILAVTAAAATPALAHAVDAGHSPAVAKQAGGSAADGGIRDAGTPDAGTATVVPMPKPVPMTPEVKALVDRLQAFYEKADDFTASFRQDYTYKAFKRTQTSTGLVTYKKPALMRWEYEKPSKKTFVLAGEKVYAYDPEAMTLTRATIGTSQLSASVTFLWGKGQLASEFAITQENCKKCIGTLLALHPLTHDPRFKEVRLEVDPQTASVLKSTVIDPDGSENAISFTGLKTNVGVAADRFKLNPPEGTQVIDLTHMGKP